MSDDNVVVLVHQKIFNSRNDINNVNIQNVLSKSSDITIDGYLTIQISSSELKKFINDIMYRHTSLSITYKKADGTIRTLDNISKFPGDMVYYKDDSPDGTGYVKKKKTPDHIIKVFDHNVNSWKSIIINNIIKLEKLKDK